MSDASRVRQNGTRGGVTHLITADISPAVTSERLARNPRRVPTLSLRAILSGGLINTKPSKPLSCHLTPRKIPHLWAPVRLMACAQLYADWMSVTPLDHMGSTARGV